jgi:hypothetical protein
MGNQCGATPSDPYHVNLCMLSYSIEQKVDDYLATNIPEAVMSNEEIAEAYRRAI